MKRILPLLLLAGAGLLLIPPAQGDSPSVMVDVEGDWSSDSNALVFPVGTPRAIDTTVANTAEEPVEGQLVAEATIGEEVARWEQPVRVPAGSQIQRQLEVRWPALQSATVTVTFDGEAESSEAFAQGFGVPALDVEFDRLHEKGRYLPYDKPLTPTASVENLAGEPSNRTELALTIESLEEAARTDLAPIEAGGTREIELPSLHPSDSGSLSVGGAGSTATTSLSGKMIATPEGPSAYEGPLFDFEVREGVVRSAGTAGFLAHVLKGTALELAASSVTPGEPSTATVWVANFRGEGTAGARLDAEISPLLMSGPDPSESTVETRSLYLDPYEERLVTFTFEPTVVGPHRLQADIDGYVLGASLDEVLAPDLGAPVQDWQLEDSTPSLATGEETEIELSWTPAEGFEEGTVGLAITPVRQENQRLDPRFGGSGDQAEFVTTRTLDTQIVNASTGERTTTFQLTAHATGIFDVAPYMETDAGISSFPDPASGKRRLEVVDESPDQLGPWLPAIASALLAGVVTTCRFRAA
ncbi:hypothetical protein BRD56_09650 [Thermoplasmatales archaeon SW_10_69_26]|nr:MAG: hypothetical protein BRD56_09650 [Thermoplasmatales archaeon SW_10_69_26]